MRRFFSTTLVQILAIIATSSAATFLVFVLLLFTSGAPPNPPWPWQAAYRIETLVEILQRAPASGRAAIIAAAERPDLSVRLTEAPAGCPALTLDTRDLEAVLKSDLHDASNVKVRLCNTADATEKVQVLMPLGSQTLDIRTDKVGRTPPRISFPFLSALLFACVGVAAMSAWAVWRVIRPLRRLSEKADAFGRNISISPIAEEGPLEVKRAAQAFNLMQERITRSIQDRTRTLAAISHDLRTPLTRMRLQIETGQPDTMRDKLLRDIDLMQSMIASALAFISGSSDGERKREWLDLGALLQTLCDEYKERGVTISYEGPDHIRFLCRPNAITRVMTNLIENAAHFGKTVIVTASADSNAITLEVADEGPGIPEDRIHDVVEPFVRLDPSRSDRPGSVGLGLSIVKEIVEWHGGTLELINRQPAGLTAKIMFPRMSTLGAGPVESHALS